MLSAAKHLFRSCFSSIGLSVQAKSTIVGVDPLQDLRKFDGGKTFKTVVDIGANIGQTALRFQKAYPEAAIHSFEPVTASYRAGKQNTARYPAVTWHHLALGNTNGPIVFYSSGLSQMNKVTSTAPNPSAQESERNEVDMIRFDDFFSANQLRQVDLLKTDTEGLDLAVLEGASTVLAEHRVGSVLCEVGFARTDKNHSYFPAVAEYLEQFGYRLFSFYGISNIEHFRRWGTTYADALFTLPGQPG